MKKSILMLALMVSVGWMAVAQTTNYGTSSGTLGTNNSFFGAFSGTSATAASNSNAYVGASSGRLTTSGNSNTAVGLSSLYTNTTGSGNVAIGFQALYSNTFNNNTAVGYKALYSSGYVPGNTAVGASALQLNTGSFNTANGYLAMEKNTTGSYNTVHGYAAMEYSTTGSSNTAMGDRALFNNTTGGQNTAIGAFAGPGFGNLNNTTALGYGAYLSVSNKVRLGNSSVTVIEGQVAYSFPSDGRFKREIKEDVSGLEFIKKLRPVSYIFDVDAFDIFQGIPEELRTQMASTREKAIRQTGFIAQEVEKVLQSSGSEFSGLVRPKNDKDNYGIRYAEFVVPLVKAVQELNAKVEAQQQTINALLLKGDSSEQKETDSQGAVLYNNNPNPFSSDTEIKMRLPETSQKATLIVYNMEGKELKSLTVYTRGETGVKISSHELSAGMYLYTLIVDGKFVDTKRMILTR